MIIGFYVIYLYILALLTYYAHTISSFCAFIFTFIFESNQGFELRSNFDDKNNISIYTKQITNQTDQINLIKYNSQTNDIDGLNLTFFDDLNVKIKGSKTSLSKFCKYIIIGQKKYCAKLKFKEIIKLNSIVFKNT